MPDSWTFKIRGELAYLNKYAYRAKSAICSLCNLGQEETVYHFLAQCPVLSEFRVKWFKKKSFQENEFADIIKGEQWMKTDYFPDLPSEI